MTKPNMITVVRGGLPLPAPREREVVLSDGEFRASVLRGATLFRLKSFREGRLVTERLATSGRPMLAWPLWLMSGSRCYIADTEGAERDVTLGLLWRWTRQLLGETISKRVLLRRVEQEVADAERSPRARPVSVRAGGAPVYLRTDLSFGIRAGGSVGHTAGVLNELEAAVGTPILMTTTPIPTLNRGIEVHQVTVPERFWNFRELPTFLLNDVFVAETLRAVDTRAVSFVYQRYSLNNYAGLQLARRLNVPFVLEYNGSEIWMGRHWGRPLKYEALATRIEVLNVRNADLVVVVSRAMRDELVTRGVESDRVLVNPNAVDPERYSPAIDGTGVRRRYGLGGHTVLGFMSTFAPWHGSVVLAHAFVRLIRRNPDLHDSVRLLMIGSGVELEAARQVIVNAGFDDLVRFTGLVPQEEGPAHLAACDLLISPHVPNPDGSPFFGSPTKLFEYMAMARGIVASNLDQIGEVLRHGETAWLVPPADVEALADGLDRLVRDAVLREALGAAARRDVVAQHTWRAHVARTLTALERRSSSPESSTSCAMRSSA